MKPLAYGAVGLLAVLLALYGGSRWLTWRAERAFPPLGRFATVDGVRLHYVEAGSGPAVVLLHGANGALQDFTTTIMPALSRRYRVIALDRPGHGHSQRPPQAGTPAAQAELLRGLLRQLGVDRPVLVGFSWSGALVLSYALRHQAELDGIVLLAGTAYPWAAPVDLKWRLPAWPILGDLAVEILVQPLAVLVSAGAVAASFAPGPVPASFGGAPWPLALRPGSFRANAEDVRNLKPALAEQSPHYGRLALPIVLLTGDRDTVVGPDTHSRPLAKTLPHAELIVVPDAGHLLPYSHPEATIAAIDRARAGRSPRSQPQDR
ncbi:MAG: alpha/beta hydrolase [Alphaproteobacteria bacterium]|nr:alpha/beta hydrolase [Alphaproteobacteria bacterium]